LPQGRNLTTTVSQQPLKIQGRKAYLAFIINNPFTISRDFPKWKQTRESLYTSRAFLKEPVNN